jgi:Zn-dependent protease
MLISIGVYAVFWGLPFAVGIVVLLLVHECGHALQMKREGIKVEGMAFIPFLGAAVWSKELGRDALAEARVGLAGPVVGSLAAAVALPLYAATDDEFWRALAYFGFFINLFNLIPVTPFDGGRAFAAMAPWMWFVGLAMMAALLLVRPNPFVLLFLVLGAMDVSRRWKTRHEERDYYRVKGAHRLAVGVVYVALAIALVAGMNATYIDPDTLD